MSLTVSTERLPIGNLSRFETLRSVFDLLPQLDWSRARVADVGAGLGHFSRMVGEALEARGIVPRARLAACDLAPDEFAYEALDCEPIGPRGRLPWDDASFDAVVSIEVIEHVEDQFGFLRELTRICRPGGTVIVTTPNTLHVGARLRTLTSGFAELYDPLPLREHSPQDLHGHIHPIAPYYLAYGALRAGLVEPMLSTDRRKRSAAFAATLLWPAAWPSGVGSIARTWSASTRCLLAGEP